MGWEVSASAPGGPARSRARRARRPPFDSALGILSSVLDELFDADRSGRALVTYALIAGMVVASGPTLVWPRLGLVLGGVGELRYPWQVWTSAFMHGWPGVPLVVHLVLNLIVIGFVGVAAEKLLGAARYLGLTALALVGYWGARRLSGVDANGASVFLWAYAPILYVGMRYAAGSGRPVGDAYQKGKGFLAIMWVIVPLAMIVLLTARGAALGAAAAWGNVFHLSATLAGVAGALLWRRRIGERLAHGAYQQSGSDRAAAVAAGLVPGALGVLVILTLSGAIRP